MDFCFPDNFEDLLESYVPDTPEPEIKGKRGKRRYHPYLNDHIKFNVRDLPVTKDKIIRRPRRNAAYKFVNMHVKVPHEDISTARSKFEVADLYFELAITQAEFGVENMFEDFRDFFVTASLSDDAALIMKFVGLFYTTISDNLDMLLTLLAQQPHHTYRSKPCLLVTYLASIYSTYEPETPKSYSCSQVQKMFSAGFANNVLSGAFRYQIKDGKNIIDPRLALSLVTANLRVKEPLSGNRLISVKFFNQTAHHAEEAKTRYQRYIDHEKLDQTFDVLSVKNKIVTLADMDEFTPGASYTIQTI